MSWLIDAVREPAAQLINLFGLALVGAATARLRGKHRQNVKRLDRVEAAVGSTPSESSSSSPQPPQS